MKASLTGVFFHVPKKFNPDQLDLRGKEDAAHWLINRIATLTNCYRHRQGTDFQNISRKTMEQFIHSADVSRVKDVLIDAEVIECDNHYVQAVHDRDGNGKSMGYRLAPGVLEEGFTKVPCRSRVIARKVLRHRIVKNRQPLDEGQFDRLEEYLYGWLRTLRIDHGRAHQIIDGLGDNYAAELGSKAACRLTVEQMVEQEAQDKPEFTICPFGRLHTCVTRLLTELRDCLSVHGQKLVGIDITNSQLVFFSLMMLESFWAQGDTDGFNWKEQHLAESSNRPVVAFSNLPPSTSAPPTPPPTAAAPASGGTPSLRTSKRKNATKGCPKQSKSEDKLVTLNKRMKGMPEDAQEFVRQVIGGTVYDNLMDATGVCDRRAFKRAFFREVLYGDSAENYAKVSNIRRVFDRAFPTVLRYIDHCKKGGYETLPQDMQRRESQFMLGAVCGRLADHHRDIPCITIHDSIMTTPEHVGTVRRVMAEEFTRIGINPAMKVGG